MTDRKKKLDNYNKYENDLKYQDNKKLPSTSGIHQDVGRSTSTSSISKIATKFTIEQKLSSGATKKGPYSIKRTVDPNKEIVIPRRFGEGIKPLFFREDVKVNAPLNKSPTLKATNVNRKRNNSISPFKKEQKRRQYSSSSSDSSSSDRKRTGSYKNRERQKTGRNKTPDKVPYFIDTKREQDRLKAKGSSYSGIHVTHSKSEKDTQKRKIRSKSRDRDSQISSSRYRNTYSYDRKRIQRRSRSRSRTRSREKDRYFNRRPPTETQFIPIPVPMEYGPYESHWLPPVPSFPYPRYPYMNIARHPPHFQRPPQFLPRPYHRQRGMYHPRYP